MNAHNSSSNEGTPDGPGDSPEFWKSHGYNLPSEFVNDWSAKHNAAFLLQLGDADPASRAMAKEIAERPVRTVDEQCRKDAQNGRVWVQFPDADIREAYDYIVAEFNRRSVQRTLTPELIMQFVRRAALFIQGESAAATLARMERK